MKKEPKLVYLFELDSARSTDEEIEIGQNALYNEIVGNGNIVVMTYNQLVDSRGFFGLFNNTDYYENFVQLFEAGAIAENIALYCAENGIGMCER